MAECDEESLYINTVDSEGDHKQKTFLASCDRHRRVENGDQKVPCGDVMAEGVPKTSTWSSKPKPAPTEVDDGNIDDGCLVSSDQIKFNLEPMCETYMSAVYAMRPEFEEKVLVKNIISKVHNKAGGFLSNREEDEVMACPTNHDKMYSLLKILRTKSNKDFMTFYEALESSGYQHFATKLKKAAGINCKPPKDPGPEATDKILKERKVAYSLHSVIEKLEAPFFTVVSEFRKQVRPLSDDLYDDVVTKCQTTMAAKAHKSRLPDVPSHRKDFIKHIIMNLTTFFDIKLIHEVANLLQQPTLTEAVVRYEADLEPQMRTAIAELTDRCEVMPINQDSPEGTYRLVLKFPDDANIRDLYEAKDYLEKVLHIPDAKLLAFDFGCILAHFEIACAPDALKDLPKKFTKHSDQLKAMGISGAFLIDHWAWGADSNDVWYANDESDDMEVNDQQGFLGNRKRSHLGSVSGGCAEIMPSKKASHLKENCPTEKGDHKQKTFLASCDRHRRVENGDQEVPCGDLMAEVVSKTNTWSLKPMPAPTEGDDENIDDGCLVSSDQVPFNSEPMSEAYRKSLYAVRPEFEKKVLVDNIMSKVHQDAGGFLSDHEEEDVKACTTNREKMSSLLKTLRTKSNKDFMNFCEVLESSDYQHFATKLRKAAGINCKPPKDPRPEATYKFLKEEKVAYSLHSVIEKLEAPFSTVVSEFRKQLHGMWMTFAVDLGVPVMDLTPRRLTPRRRWTEQKCILQYKTRSDSVLKEAAIVLPNWCGTDGDCRESDCHYQTNLRSSKLLKLSSGGISSTQPALRRLARKRRNRLKAISSSAQSLNCHHRKSQRTIHTSRTSHTSSLPSLAQPQTSSVQSDPTDEVESTRMDQTDSGFSNDQ